MTSAAVIMATVVMATTCTAQRPHQPEHFKIGFLAPWNGSFDDFSALTSASAISIAIERIHNDPTLNKSMRFRLVTSRTCNYNLCTVFRTTFDMSHAAITGRDLEWFQRTVYIILSCFSIYFLNTSVFIVIFFINFVFLCLCILLFFRFCVYVYVFADHMAS